MLMTCLPRPMGRLARPVRRFPASAEILRSSGNDVQIVAGILFGGATRRRLTAMKQHAVIRPCAQKRTGPDAGPVPFVVSRCASALLYRDARSGLQAHAAGIAQE